MWYLLYENIFSDGKTIDRVETCASFDWIQLWLSDFKHVKEFFLIEIL